MEVTKVSQFSKDNRTPNKNNFHSKSFTINLNCDQPDVSYQAGVFLNVGQPNAYRFIKGPRNNLYHGNSTAIEEDVQSQRRTPHNQDVANSVGPTYESMKSNANTNCYSYYSLPDYANISNSTDDETETIKNRNDNIDQSCKVINTDRSCKVVNNNNNNKMATQQKNMAYEKKYIKPHTSKQTFNNYKKTSDGNEKKAIIHGGVSNFSIKRSKKIDSVLKGNKRKGELYHDYNTKTQKDIDGMKCIDLQERTNAPKMTKLANESSLDIPQQDLTECNRLIIDVDQQTDLFQTSHNEHQNREDNNHKISNIDIEASVPDIQILLPGHETCNSDNSNGAKVTEYLENPHKQDFDASDKVVTKPRQLNPNAPKFVPNTRTNEQNLKSLKTFRVNSNRDQENTIPKLDIPNKKIRDPHKERELNLYYENMRDMLCQKQFNRILESKSETPFPDQFVPYPEFDPYAHYGNIPKNNMGFPGPNMGYPGYNMGYYGYNTGPFQYYPIPPGYVPEAHGYPRPNPYQSEMYMAELNTRTLMNNKMTGEDRGEKKYSYKKRKEMLKEYQLELERIVHQKMEISINPNYQFQGPSYMELLEKEMDLQQKMEELLRR